MDRATPAGRPPIPSIPYLCDNLVLQARAWPHPLLIYCDSPPSPRWRSKSSKCSHSACFSHSGSALHCCHPLLSPSIYPHRLPFKSLFRVIIAFKFVSHPPWSLVPSVRLGSSSLHLSYRAVVPVALVRVLKAGTRLKDAREVLLLIACHSAGVPRERVVGLMEAH
jgi:hypothetical protein